MISFWSRSSASFVLNCVQFQTWNPISTSRDREALLIACQRHYDRADIRWSGALLGISHVFLNPQLFLYFILIWFVLLFRYVAKGNRLMKNQQLMEELDQSMDDRIEKTRLMEGFLGYIICSTQVIFFYFSSILVSGGTGFLLCKSLITLLLMHSGSNNSSSICCIRSKGKSWNLGVCQSKFHGSGCWKFLCWRIFEIQRNDFWRAMVSWINLIFSNQGDSNKVSLDYHRAKNENALEVDFGAFDYQTPHLSVPASIGKGLQFTSRFIASKMDGKIKNMTLLLDYLIDLNYRGDVRIRKTSTLNWKSRISYFVE